MKISELVLFNFRLFEYCQFSFVDGINVITGANGQGKTSVLEAIALFALGKSVRARQDGDVIQFGQPSAQLRIGIKGKNQINQLAVKITDKGKQIAVNHVRKGSIMDLIGKFQMVLFTPDDLDMIKGSPDGRRKFLNQYMAQIPGDLIQNVRTYQRLLIQRNLLLKQRQFSAVPTWDESLSEIGAKITYDRGIFVEKISDFAKRRYQQLATDEEVLDILYRPSVEGITLSDIAKQMAEGLMKNFAKDKEKGFTSIGPHRDELIFSIEDRPAARYASQGQIRSAVLAVKIALMDYFQTMTGEYPVLLLDDVLSELDAHRRSALMGMIQKTQTIMTVSDWRDVQGINGETGRIFEVAHGIIKNER